MDEEYELTQILSYAPTQDKPGKNTRLVTSGLTKVTLPDTGNPLEHFRLTDYYSGNISCKSTPTSCMSSVCFVFEVKKVLEEYRYELIQRHMILGRDVVLKSWQSKELFEDSSSNLTKIVEDLKKSHPNTSEEDLVRLFDSAKLEINEYYTKCTIGDKVIYVDYCSRDFVCERPLSCWKAPIASKTSTSPRSSACLSPTLSCSSTSCKNS